MPRIEPQEDLGSADRVQRDNSPGGLVLSRKKGEALKIGDVLLQVISVSAGGNCRFRLIGPRNIPISRVE